MVVVHRKLVEVDIALRFLLACGAKFIRILRRYSLICIMCLDFAPLFIK